MASKKDPLHSAFGSDLLGGFSGIPDSLKAILEQDRLIRGALPASLEHELARAAGFESRGAISDTIRQAVGLGSPYSRHMGALNDALGGGFGLRPQMEALFGPASALGLVSGSRRDSHYGIAHAIEEAIGQNSTLAKEMKQVEKVLSDLGRGIQRDLGLVRTRNLDVASLAMTSSINNTAASISRALHDNLFKSGFLATAELAYQGGIGRGLASEILDHYNLEAKSASSLFENSLDLARTYDGDVSNTNEHDIIQQLIKIQALLSNLIGKLDKKDAIGWAGWLAILTFIFAIYDHIGQNKDTGRLIELHEQEVEIERRSEEARENERKFIRYVIAKTPLRVGPNKEAQLTRYIFPDQWLRVINVQGNWLFVEVYEYSSDHSIKGWVYRGNVRISQ
jgi:hypothetical protein